MKIMIDETGFFTDLCLLDPTTGMDFARDFLATTGCLEDGDFVKDDDLDAYVCDGETSAFWTKVLAEQQKLYDHVGELIEAYGGDDVSRIFGEMVGVGDVEDEALTCLQGLNGYFDLPIPLTWGDFDAQPSVPPYDAARRLRGLGYGTETSQCRGWLWAKTRKEGWVHVRCQPAVIEAFACACRP